MFFRAICSWDSGGPYGDGGGFLVCANTVQFSHTPCWECLFRLVGTGFSHDPKHACSVNSESLCQAREGRYGDEKTERAYFVLNYRGQLIAWCPDVLYSISVAGGPPHVPILAGTIQSARCTGYLIASDPERSGILGS